MPLAGSGDPRLFFEYPVPLFAKLGFEIGQPFSKALQAITISDEERRNRRTDGTS